MVKALLLEVLDARELRGGNGLVETATSLAILLGLIAGGGLMSIEGAGPLLTRIALLLLALLGDRLSPPP